MNKNRVSKRLTTSKDTIQLENVAISPVNFEIKNQKGQLISSNKYNVNYAKGQLFFNTQQPQQITVSYFNYPTFLTQTYSPFDKKLIISKATPQAQTYSLKKEYSKKDFFGGINTYGNITRGITVGNNQGSVLNSGLDLQITGNLSENLKIRASIKDSNVPIQENGVSQNINEFDRVFIELFTDTWNLKAGDVDLTNHDSYFLNFTKKINGAKLDVVLDNGDQKTTITASGALAKGRFNTQNITTQEGNQGPYRLLGVNGEQNIVIISNSETIYVNGVTLKRGEQYDYTIDYNLSEITFNPTFPINSSQRIIVDYQYSDQNYNRFVTHDGVKYETEKFSIGTYFYNENDVKNQPIQQNLSDVQKQTLQQAGNNPANMVAPSAQTSNYDENRIQYLKNEDGNFIQSSNENETLYNVIFSFVGNNQGDYILSETVATGSIYEYIAPINGISQGNYSPITQLFAPTKTQMAVVNTSYKINKKSFINAELAYSDNDQNLFSTIDDKQNKGIATTLAWQQQISDKDWKSYNLLDVDFVQKNFNNIEGLYNAEFNRDWNIDVNLTPNFLGNQSYLRNAFTLQKDEQHQFVLNNEYLSFGADFTGLKNALNTFNSVKKLSLKTENSFVNSKNILEKGTFIRHHSSLKYRLKKIWVTGLLDYENNHQKNKKTQLLDSIQSQKYSAIGADFGVGDSTKVYTKFSYSLVKIDSVKTNRLERVQNTHNYSIESQIIKNKQASLHTFINYRKVNHLFFEDVDIMNARTLYNQQLFKDIIRLSTVYETSSGNTLQQNFTYIETEPGQGYYYYLGDLNNNGKKDFDEFEVAQFTDQANYLRVILPNTNRVATQKAKLSQSIFINFMQYQNHTSKWLQLLSHFSNQSSILINKDQLKQGKAFNINPFNTNNKNVVALQQNVFTSFYFNRGLQNYSTTYTYQNNQNTQNTSSDIETATQESHELNFQHNTQSSWVLGTVLRTKNIENTSQSYSSRNFNLASYTLNPSVDFLKDEFSTLKATYTYRNEKNKIGEEALISHDFGLNYNYNNLGKGSVLASINIIENNYKGAINTPASYRILEGLEPNRNYTWSLIIQRKLTQLLDLSINYNGRKNTSTNTIHVGSVQLRANF
ncbi:hypothetical protein FHR24_000364 [Wenyingzhuangia heitensis]|uniref:Cell surface protein SprA n=1 Tax=Wenyingzhuangia heitensis TaxID=1487859 RepID=A0ABX0U7I3_9FLAO|nr:hypothetical protein [Wenyingzhuangia heitensis]NIJ43925.1 hypothetical protein [Wenyingzhuangia heitensis]